MYSRPIATLFCPNSPAELGLATLDSFARPPVASNRVSLFGTRRSIQWNGDCQCCRVGWRM